MPYLRDKLHLGGIVRVVRRDDNVQSEVPALVGRAERPCDEPSPSVDVAVDNLRRHPAVSSCGIRSRIGRAALSSLQLLNVRQLFQEACMLPRRASRLRRCHGEKSRRKPPTEKRQVTKGKGREEQQNGDRKRETERTKLGVKHGGGGRGRGGMGDRGEEGENHTRLKTHKTKETGRCNEAETGDKQRGEGKVFPAEGCCSQTVENSLIKIPVSKVGTAAVLESHRARNSASVNKIDRFFMCTCEPTEKLYFCNCDLGQTSRAGPHVFDQPKTASLPSTHGRGGVYAE